MWSNDIKKSLIILFTILLALISCDDQSFTNKSPRIINAVVVDENGYSVATGIIGETIYLIFQAEDKDRDMVLLHYSFSDGCNTKSGKVAIINSPADVDINYLPVLLEGSVEVWSITLLIEDLAGNMSNIYTLSFTISS